MASKNIPSSPKLLKSGSVAGNATDHSSRLHENDLIGKQPFASSNDGTTEQNAPNKQKYKKKGLII